MKRMLAAFCVLALVGADKPEEKKANELVGVWKLVSHTYGGKDTKFEQEKLDFRGGGTMITQLADAAPLEGTYTIDPAKTPKHLDINPSVGDNIGKPMKLIFVVDGNTLTICGESEPADRPTEFISKKGTKQWVYVLKREKK